MEVKNYLKIKRRFKWAISVIGGIFTVASVLTSVLTLIDKTESSLYNGCINMFCAIFAHPLLYILCVLLVYVLVVVGIELITNRCVRVDLDSDRKIEIKRCNLFKQKGIKVIHCHDTFEIKHNDAIIKGSVLEEFISKNDKDEIENQIKSKISEDKKRIGETCFVDLEGEGEHEYVLFAFSKRDGCNVKLSDKEYRETIKKLWDAFRDDHNNIIGENWINVVVMGDTRNNLSLKGEKLLLYMVQSFIKSNAKKNLRICLKKGKYKNVDLYGLKYIIEHMK